MQDYVRGPKRADSKYLSGHRTDNSSEIKTSKRLEAVIVEFTVPRRTRPYFGALTLAVREKKGWRYIGHVGTGFSHKTLEALLSKLVKLKAAVTFSAKVKDQAVHLGKASLVAEVKFPNGPLKAKCGILSILAFDGTSGLRTSHASAKSPVTRRPANLRMAVRDCD